MSDPQRKCRIRRKDCRIQKCRIRREECRIQELLSPGRELTSGSKYLICRWIFGSAKKIVRSESVGSAEKSVGSGCKSDAEPCREGLRPKLLKSGMNSERLSKGMVSYWNRRGSKVQLQTDPDPRQKSEQIRTRRSGLRYLPNLNLSTVNSGWVNLFVSLDFINDVILYILLIPVHECSVFYLFE